MRRPRIVAVRAVVTALLAVAHLLVRVPTAPATPAVAEPLVGAIRWDAWAPQYSYSAASLFTDYDYREPSLGWYVGGVPDHAAIVDREIDYAADHGLDYWAFVWYPETTGEQQGAIMSAFNDYYASAKRDRLKFAFVVQTPWVAAGRPDDPAGREAQWRSEFVPYFVAKFRDPGYVRVNGNRPLVYWFGTDLLGAPTTRDQEHCDAGFCENWRAELDHLKAETVAAGLGEPFFVDVTYDVTSARAYGFDGVTTYGPAGAAPMGGAGHKCWWQQASRDADNRAPQDGLVTVPALTAVNDGRPRGHSWWVDQPTYGEWERHVRSAYDWAREHPSRTTDPPTLLTYAWNELDEGGPGIVPTKQNGTMFLDAIRAVTSGDYPATYVDVRNGDNCAIRYGGPWTREFPRRGLFGNDEQTTDAATAFAELPADGATGFEVVSRTGPDRGRMEVLVDGVHQAVVDLYAPAPGRATVFTRSGLPPGPHTLTLVATGTRTAASAGTTVGVDSIAVTVARSALPVPRTGEPVTDAAVPYASPANLARGRAYRGSSEWSPDQSAAQAFDGRYDSNWQAALGSPFAGSWLEVDFGQEISFDEVVLTEYGGRTGGFKVLYYVAGVWLEAYTGTTIGDRTPVRFRFPPVRGSRARLLFTSGTATPIVYEFEVYLRLA